MNERERTTSLNWESPEYGGRWLNVRPETDGEHWRFSVADEPDQLTASMTLPRASVADLYEWLGRQLGLRS